MAYFDFYPFGKLMGGRYTTSNDDRYKFTGHELDEEAGLDLSYAGARYLDSEIGTWLSIDPLADSYPGWSPYNYTMGNPVNMIDPTGEGPWDFLTGLYNSAEEGVTTFVNTVKSSEGVADFLTKISPLQWADGESPDLNNNPTSISEAFQDMKGDAVNLVESIKGEVNELSQKSGDELHEALGEKARGLIIVAVTKGKRKKLIPNPTAQDIHTTFKVDANGKVTNHATWIPDSNNPSGFKLGSRTDLQGAPHFDKKTGTLIKTPHTHKSNGKVRPAKKDEIPPK